MIPIPTTKYSTSTSGLREVTPIRLFNIDNEEEASDIGCKFDLLAKSKNRGGTPLADHLLEAGFGAMTIADLSLFPEESDQNLDLLRITCLTAGIFHDLGKAANGFQAMIQSEEVDRWPKEGGGNRHEILSAAIFFYNFRELETWKTHPSYFKSVFLAILTHHKAFRKLNGTNVRRIPPEQFFDQPHFKLMYGELNCNVNKISKVWEKIIQSLSEDQWCNQLIGSWIPQKLIIPSVDEITNYANDMITLIDGYNSGTIYPARFTSPPEERRLIAAIRAFLMSGDHLSSGAMFNLIPTPSFSKYTILPSEKSPYHFQETVGKINGNAILIAPTGSGKTEAALFWLARNQSYNGRDAKVFYVLPFSASINAMATRLHKILEVKTGLVGIQHAKAADVFYSIIEEEIEEKRNLPSDPPGSGQNTKEKTSQKTAPDTKKDIIKPYNDPWSSLKVKSTYSPTFSKHVMIDTGRERYQPSKAARMHSQAARQLASLCREVFYPVKVTTPHQLLRGVLQGRGWESTVLDFHGACFILDEIHSYEPHVVGLILGLVDTLVSQFNAKVLIMSATFPKHIIDKIQALPVDFPHIVRPDPVKDKKILDKKRHRIEVIDTSLLNYLKVHHWGDEQTLVVCNTVGTAQQAYSYLSDKFGEDKVLLFHSRFKQRDRNSIEKKVLNHKNEDYKIVVATQVVEVSLDIDFTNGICEVAPLDALVQRMGRVNRKGKRYPDTTNIWITQREDNSSYVYENDLMSYSHKLLKQYAMKGIPLSELDLVTLVDQLYEKHPWTEAEEARFNRSYKLTSREFFKDCLPGSYRYWIDDVIDQNGQIEVILEDDWKEYLRTVKYSPVKAGQFLVKMWHPSKEFLDTSNRKLPPVLKSGNFSYNKKTGLRVYK